MDKIKDEMQELVQDMDVNIQVWALSFFNLVFGRGHWEHDAFWNDVLIPEASAYYSYPIEEFTKHPMRFNALYFSFTELTGIKVTMIEQASKDARHDQISSSGGPGNSNLGGGRNERTNAK